jgi:release factor glutamine methyltransferase
MSPVRQLLAWGTQQMGGSADAAAEAGLLLAHVLQKDRGWLFAWPEAEVGEEDATRYRELAARRAAGEPIAYLTGRRDFWSLQLAVDRHTLIPRPETEHLIEFVLQGLPAERPLRVIDLGTGSGAIALALASERPAWRITASDRSPAALAVARDNALRHGLQLDFVQADWLQGLRGPFDLIVSNPPYIATGDRHLQEGDPRFEPASALVSGNDGLNDIRLIIAQALPLLAAGGWLVFEHGFEQGAACRELLLQAGYRDVGTGRDLAGHERYSYGIRDYPLDQWDFASHD